MNLSLAGKVTIVTGATANIGRAIALELAAEGVCLVAVGRDQEAGEKLIAQALESVAEKALFIAADLLDSDSPRKILEEAETLGRWIY